MMSKVWHEKIYDINYSANDFAEFCIYGEKRDQERERALSLGNRKGGGGVRSRKSILDRQLSDILWF